MKRLEELRAKLAEGTITEDEQQELDDLEAAEAANADAENKTKALADQVEKLVDSKVEEKLAAHEKTIRDNFFGGISRKPGDATKEVKTLRWLKALANNDFMGLARMKADYMNETTDSEGGYLVPPPEFVADVLRLEEEFGVALRNASVRRTGRTSVLFNKKAGGVTIYNTAEAGTKRLTKMQFAQVEVPLRKWAAIAPLTDELDEDAAVDIYNELTKDFARAYAEQADKLVFTDATYGIENISGTNEVLITQGTITGLTFDHLNRAMYAVPTPSMKNGKWYFHRTILGVIQRIKDENNNYIWAPGPNGPADGTIWGRPYELVDVMSELTDDALDTPFIVFGDLRNTQVVIRNSMALKVLEEATVGGANGDAEIDLASQDMKALRAVQRMDARTIFANAYTVIRTSTTS